MAKIKYKYAGKRRPESQGKEKLFDKKELTPEKLESLESKGWVKVVDKPKPVKKKEEDNG